PVPPRARDQAAGDLARGGARVSGGLEGAPESPRAPVRGQAAAHLQQRQRPWRRRRQEARGRAHGRPAGRDRLGQLGNSTSGGAAPLPPSCFTQRRPNPRPQRLATHSDSRASIASRTRRNTESRASSSPVAREGSANDQCKRFAAPGKNGQRSLASSQTVIT